ncbi:hypothetical protein B5E82_04460 [Lachnoclostridium sp. An138]|nr:hypothetical protein B5E82_04460 [Lachnoclostridium sp. An138]
MFCGRRFFEERKETKEKCLSSSPPMAPMTFPIVNELNILPIESPASERSFYMIHDNLVFMSPAVQDFRQYVLEKCRL